MILEIGFPRSMSSLGFNSDQHRRRPRLTACMVAANLKLCPGTTRSSWSAVAIIVGGYCAGFKLCSGEYA